VPGAKTGSDFPQAQCRDFRRLFFQNNRLTAHQNALEAVMKSTKQNAASDIDKVEQRFHE